MWDPDQYIRYADLRLRPAINLLTRIDFQSPRRIVDLGCGVGNVTQMIANRWPEAEPEAYHHILAPHVSSLAIWETVYLHVLEGEDSVAEWTGATWGKPLLNALDDDDRQAYEADSERFGARGLSPF